MTKLDCARYSAVVLLLGLGLMAVARADSRPDPTRPDAAWLATQPAVAGGQMAGHEAASGVRVMVIGRARKFAIIDGQMVRVGETYNGAKLVGFHADGVVMQRDGGKEKLSMSSAVVKKVEGSKPVVGRAKSGKIVVIGEGQ